MNSEWMSVTTLEASDVTTCLDRAPSTTEMYHLSSGSHKSTVKVWAGPIPSEAV